VISVGEVKQLVRHHRCTCHDQDPQDCPFWSLVSAYVTESVGLDLHELALIDGISDDVFLRHNQALYSALFRAGRCTYIVDSSKSLSRFRKLLRASRSGADFDLIPVHLRRGAFGTLNSAHRKERDLKAPIYSYCKDYFKSREVLQDIEYVEVYYENLARNPRRELSRIMQEIGLVFEDSQLQWRNAVVRDVGGNRMRRGSSNVIRLDQAWRRELTLALKIRIFIQTLPVRLRSRFLFKLWRSWLKPVKGTPKLSS